MTITKKFVFNITCFVVILGAVSLIHTLNTAQAQQANVFTVAGISVDETAETATEARDLAVQAGKEAAFRALLNRLVPEGYQDQYPRLTNAALDSLILGVEVFDEKRSSVRYLADLKINFQPSDVRSLLRRSGLPFSETISKPLLVFPVMQYGFDLTLWGTPNPWRLAWQRRETSQALVPVLVPLGDIEDRQVVDARAARQGATERLSLLRERYNAGDVLVVEAKYSDDRPTQMELAIDYYGGVGARSLMRTFNRPEGVEDLSAFMDMAAATIHEEIVEIWKGRTLIQLGTLSRLIARVPLSSYTEWLDIRKKLKSVSVMDRVSLTSLTNIEARLDLQFYGNPQQLAVALAQEDILLNRAGGMWTIVKRR